MKHDKEAWDIERAQKRKEETMRDGSYWIQQENEKRLRQKIREMTPQY